MAKELKNIFDPSVDEVQQTFTINAWHVSQSVDALTGTEDYDITISGSLTVTGSILHAGIQDANGVASSVLVRDDSTGEYYITGSYGVGGSSNTGSLLTTASVSNNDITFTKGDGTTFVVTVDTGSGGGGDTNIANTNLTLDNNRTLDFGGNSLKFNAYQGETFEISSSNSSEVKISGLPNSSQPHVVAYDAADGTLSYVSTGSFGGSTSTGSLLTTASVSGTDITFEKGDGSTFNITIVSSSYAVTSSFAATASHVLNPDYVSTVTYNTGTIDFTGEGNAFDGELNINDLTSSLLTTSSFNNATGSFLTTGSVTNNTITFEKGDGTTFVITVDTGSGGGGSTDYVSNVVYQTGSIDFTGVGNAFDSAININDLTASLISNDDTGSFMTTGSVSGNTVTFTKGDGTTFDVTIVSSSYAITSSYAVTASHVLNPDYVSTVTYNTGTIDFTGEGNAFDGELNINDLTASLLTTSSFNTATGSFLTSGSFNDGSAAITLYSDNGDYTLDLSSLSGGGGGLAITASNEGSVLTQNARSFDFVGNAVTATNSGNAVTVTVGTGSLPSGLLSSSAQISTDISGAFATGSFLTTGSVTNNTITFEKGDGTTFDITILSSSYSVTSSFAATASYVLNPDYVSTVTYATGTIDFTGEGNAFDGELNINDLTSSLLTTSSFNNATGSFLTTGSVTNNTITFEKGDGTTFVITVDTGSGGGGSTDYVSNVVYQTGSIDFTGVGNAFDSAININDLTASLISNDDTGSFMTTGSVSGNTVTFTKGDGTTFDVTIVSSSYAITSSYASSALSSSYAVSSSYGPNIYNTDGGLTGNRNVTANGFALTWSFQAADWILNSDPGVEVQINNLTTQDSPQVLGVTNGVVTYMNTSSFGGGGGGGTPDTPLNSLQFNSASAFGGSELYYDETNIRLGINVASPVRPLHISSSIAQALRLESTVAENQYIQFYPLGASGAGSLIGGVNVNDFGILNTDGTIQTNQYVSASGEIFFPRISNSNQQHLAAFDTASGEVTYVTASEYVSGVVDTQFLQDLGQVNVTSPFNSFPAFSGSAYILITGSSSIPTASINIASPSGVFGGEGLQGGLEIYYIHNGQETDITVFQNPGPPDGSSVFHKVATLKRTGFYGLNLTTTGADGQKTTGAVGDYHHLPVSRSINTQNIGASTTISLNSDYNVINATANDPGDTLTLLAGSDQIVGTTIRAKVNYTISNQLVDNFTLKYRHKLGSDETILNSVNSNGTEELTFMVTHTGLFCFEHPPA
jgi:acid stress-induced BolA-like protein IbaG/YrbA